MDFAFLFDSQRKLFHIGYNLSSGRLDPNYYDLLASEARLASLIAIAKRDVPQRHWLQMSRPFAWTRGEQVLLSWSGTMFEYLMPALLCRGYPGTLLYENCVAAVACQRSYAADRNVPWGISESGFYQFDQAQSYQYRAFGVPGLGLRRGLDEDLVITPYASLLAIGIDPEHVLDNLTRLEDEGMQGRYGLYEAIDYSEDRLLLGKTKGIVQSFMAHHQGMILLAVTNYLLGDPMVERFHADPSIRSVELLLQEQLPAAAPVDTLAQTQVEAPRRTSTPAPSTQPWTVPVDTPAPAAHLLANGDLVSVVTNSGGGYLAWRDLTLTRWRADSTLDAWGLWTYLQDRTTGETWSIGRQPTGVTSEGEVVRYYPHMAEFRHHRGALGVQMTVTVAPTQDVEVRRIELTNAGDTPLKLRITSYGEVALGDYQSDLRHQAFAKLFVESEFLPEYNALLFRRRPRSQSDPVRRMAHALVRSDGERQGIVYTSDRAAFLGRGRTSRHPAALDDGGHLDGVTGATLDPVMALGCDVEIPAHGDVAVALITTAADTREQIEETLAHYQNWMTVTMAFSSARNQADRSLHEQGLRADDVALYDRLLSLLLYPHAQGRAAPEILARNELGQSGLWSFGISGDYPILLVRVADTEQGGQLRRFIQAHAYWRRRGLLVDLVLINEEETNYGESVHGAIWRLLQRTNAVQTLNLRGGIFLLHRDQMRPEEYTLLQTVARVVLDADEIELTDQLAARGETPTALPDLIVTLSPEDAATTMPSLPRPQDLRFDNGLGGFSADGRDYVVYLEPGETTPAPWINVVANEQFGFIASESGGGYSWAENSGENRLTAWRNDPVIDMPAEALYVRDEETGEVWSPTPLPAPADAAYRVQHGAGYTTFDHHSHGLAQRVRLFITPDAPVKYVQVRLRNHSARGRRLTVTFYAEWVLGGEHSVTTPFLVPDFHGGEASSYLTVRNPYHPEFGERCAFLATTKEIHGYTTDRTEFLGRNGDYARPAALRRVGLNDSDPARTRYLRCAASAYRPAAGRRRGILLCARTGRDGAGDCGLGRTVQQ